MSEMLTNIKFLKLYGWQDWFCNRIENVRSEETKFQRKAIERYIVFEIVSSLARNLIPVVTFSFFVHMGGTLDLALVIVA